MDLRDWLLGDDADPSIRWQTLRDLDDAPADEVAAARARVATEGWGGRLLALQTPDGLWDGGVYNPSWHVHHHGPDDGDGYAAQPWTGTFHTLKLLTELGMPPEAAETQTAVARTRDQVHWEGDDAARLFFEGESEECVNAGVLFIGATYGQDVDQVAERLLADQQPDGGWNCDRARGSTRSSFHSTICVLEGLLAYEQATGGTPETREARLRGEEHLLERGLMRTRRTGELIDPTFLEFSFPTRFFYDVLRALDHLRATGAPPHPRTAEALQLVRDKRHPDGTWALENSHPGEVAFPLEGPDGAPSRWNTLRALRVLCWAGDDVAL